MFNVMQVTLSKQLVSFKISSVLYIYISRVRERLRDFCTLKCLRGKKNCCVAGNILLVSYGLRSIGSAVQGGAWKSEGSTVRDLATVEGKFLKK